MVLAMALLGSMTAPAVATAAPATTDAAVPQVTHCSSYPQGIFRQRLEGDLIVDAGTRCDIERVSVTGSVQVGPGAEVFLSQSTVKGDLVLQGYASLYRTSVLGGVQLASADADLWGYDCTIRHSVRGPGKAVFLDRSRVEGALTVSPTKDVVLSDSTFGGWVTLRRTSAAVSGSVFDKGVTVLGWTAPWRQGSEMFTLCRSRIAGDVTVARITTWVTPRMNLWVCDLDDVNQIAGSLTLTDGNGTVWVGDTAVGGDLVCWRNERNPTVEESVTVAGVRVGQCA